MGYKLAGYEHLGGVEIDPKVAAVYKANHKPKHLYVEDIRAFNQRTDLPAELFSLDLLDGSPPCSSFSSALSCLTRLRWALISASPFWLALQSSSASSRPMNSAFFCTSSLA